MILSRFSQSPLNSPAFLSGFDGILIASIGVGGGFWKNDYESQRDHRKKSGLTGRWMATDEDGLMKILLAVDGSPCSDEAIGEIARRPWPMGSEIKVLTAFELPLQPTPEAWAIPPNYFKELDRAASEHAQSVVERAVTKLESAMADKASVKGEVAPGPPRIVILDEAQSWGADLIVVGSHGYSTWERLLLGSVSQFIVSHAKCSVEVVRCGKSAAPSPEKASRSHGG